jgi:hypothetical protein
MLKDSGVFGNQRLGPFEKGDTPTVNLLQELVEKVEPELEKRTSSAKTAMRRQHLWHG